MQAQKYRSMFKALGLAAVAIALTVAFQPVGLSMAQGGTRIYLDPASLTLPGVTEVKVENVSNLAGVEFHLSFNPSVVEVVSATAGSFFTGNTVPMPIVPVFDNTLGTVDFVGSVVTPTQPFTGTNTTVAVITWKAKSATCTPGTITFTSSKLSDPNGFAILHTRTDGSYCPVPPTPTGKVLLQGRTNHAGTMVYLTEDACPTVQALSVKGLPNVVTGVTDAQGNFTITPLVGKTYQCLLATHDMYLVARKVYTAPGDQGTVTLLGGNVVPDKTVNIFDLARIANAIGGTDATVDINADGKVDVYDLTIAAGNFGKEGPLPW